MNKLKLAEILDKTIFYLTLFLFAFIPLFPKFPILNVQGTFVAIRVEDFLISLILGLWLIYLFLSKNLSFFTKDYIGRSFLLFFFIAFVSLFSAIFLTHSAAPHLGILHFLRRAELMFLLPVVYLVFTTKRRLNFALIILFFAVSLVNIYGLGQQYLDWPVVSTTNSEFSKGQILRLTPGARVNSTFAGHYDLAVFLNMALVLAVSLFFAVSKRFKLFFILVGALSLFVLILTAARVSFVAVFIGLIFALIFSQKKKYLLIVASLFILVALYPSQLRDRFISTVNINLFNLGQRYQGRDSDQRLEQQLNIPTLSYSLATRSATQSGFAQAREGIPVDVAPGEPVNLTELAVYRSFQIRLDAEWPKAVNAFLKNPFLGTGYASLGLATDNDFLRSLGEIGLLGTTAIGIVLLSIWKRVYKGIKNNEKLIKYFSAGTLSVIIVFLVNGIFIDVFEASKIASLFWMILGLNLAAVKFGSK